MGYIEELRQVVGHRPLILVGSVVVIIDKKRILLEKRKTTSYGKWGLPGGLMELGESSEDTARREVFEETGLVLGKLNFIDVDSGKDSLVRVPNGDEFYAVTIAYYCEESSGKIVMDEEESLEVRYFPFDEIPENIVKSHGKIIEKFLRSYKEIILKD